jgi:hydrogenase maturation factor
MTDNYVYVSVKLYLKEGQTEESIHEIVQEMDYSFEHSQINDHEIIDILDTQISQGEDDNYIDLYDMSSYPDEVPDDS